MKVEIEQLTGWEEAYKDACLTVNKIQTKPIETKKQWKLSVLYPEHSPIRSVLYRVKLYGIKSWIATQLARHHVGSQPFVSTQRPDRTNKADNRDNYPQGALVNIHLVLNAQTLINISRERLCSSASKETREVWNQVLNALSKIDPELRSVCVKKCIYRGFCTERECCGFVNTVKYTNSLINYRGGVNGWQKAAKSEWVEEQDTSIQLGEKAGEEQESKGSETRKIATKGSGKKGRKAGTFAKSKRDDEAQQLSTKEEIRNPQQQTT